MRILIASGLYPPEIGGPATYVHMLADALASPKRQVTVVTFSSVAFDADDLNRAYKLVRVVRGNKLWNRVRFFKEVRKQLRSDAYDVVYMLDWFAAGLPTACAAKWQGVPYVVRVGGDYLWEQRYLESNQPPVTLAEFYEHGLYRRIQYRPFYLLIRWVLRGAAHVVFNSDRQRGLYERFYDLKKGRISTIYNPVPRAMQGGERVGRRKEFVFWGRFIVMKNLTNLIRAFAQADVPDYTLTLIGEGPRRSELENLARELGLQKRVTFSPPMRRDALPDRVKYSRAAIIPSWTDISPNQVYEALAIGLPALVTKENYLSIAEKLPATIDPHSVKDIADKLEMLADDARYEEFSKRFNTIRFEHTWDDVGREHLELFTSVARGNRRENQSPL